MIVKTQNGSTYLFNERGYLLHGSREYKVKSVSPIRIGEKLIIRAFQLNPYTCKPSDEESYIQTTRVVEII